MDKSDRNTPIERHAHGESQSFSVVCTANEVDADLIENVVSGVNRLEIVPNAATVDDDGDGTSGVLKHGVISLSAVFVCKD